MMVREMEQLNFNEPELKKKNKELWKKIEENEQN